MATISDGSTFNSVFLNNFDDENFSRDGKAKLSSWGKTYIRDKLYEEATIDKILKPKKVLPTDPGVQISLNHDTLYKLEFIEPNSTALTTSFRGTGPAEIIKADRVAVSFYTIMSPEIQKVEQELMVYAKGDFPLTKIIEDLTIKSMQELKDRPAVGFFEAAVQGHQKEANGNVATKLNSATVAAGTVVLKSVVKSRLAVQAGDITFKVYAPIKEDFVNAKKLYHGTRLEPEFAVMPKTDYDSLTLQTLQDLGSNLTGEVAKKGYTFSEFAGLNIVTTIKYEIYRPGNIYVFANEDFVGRNYILNDMKFYVDKKKNIISWCAWFDLGMAIINTAGVKKIELFGGSVVPTQTDTGYAVMDPFAEEQLNTVNNRIIQGVGPYPTISIY